VVALPLALSSPFPTPKQSEWIIQSSSFDGGPTMQPPPLVPPPMEALPVAALQVEPPVEQLKVEQPEIVTGALADQPAAAEPAPEPEFNPAPKPTPMAFAARWDLTVPPRNDPPRIEVPAEATRLPPADSVAVAAPPKRHDTADPVEQYLWEVYQRKPIKTDSTGDFTWKDPAAAKKRGLSLQAYVIGGMDPDFREQLYHAGHAMDAGGLHWSMLSAFRDDYRQALASGFKAHGGNSLHGGSTATGGYGHGRAIDITTADGDASAVWHWIDSHGAKFGLNRPMPGADPAHIQPRPAFHDLAHQLREARLKLDNQLAGVVTEPAAAKMKVAWREEEPSRSRRHRR
jgi:hypothetical protein